MKYVWRQALVVMLACLVMVPATAQDVEEIIARDAQAGMLYSAGDYDAALVYARETLAMAERALGVDDPQTLTLASHLGVLYQALGRHAEAEPLFVRTLEARERVLGMDHQDTLSSANELGGIYRAMDRYADAERHYLRALEARERVLGEDHPDTLVSVNNLASFYQATSRFVEAEQLYLRALTGLNPTRGPADLNAIAAVNNLASLYYSTARYSEAERLFAMALRANEDLRGPDHPNTLSTVHNLASVYRTMGRQGEAESHFARALEGRARVLKWDHPDTLGSASALAGLYQSEGRFEEAEQLLVRTVEVRERVLRPDHLSMLVSYSNLALLYSATGRIAEAETLFVRALKGLESSHGVNHMPTLQVMTDLADFYVATARHSEAETLYVRALAGLDRVVGRDHNQSLSAMNNLATLYTVTSRFGEAEALLEGVVEASERVLGTDHPSTLTSTHNLATLYQATDRFGEAEALQRSGVERWAARLGQGRSVSDRLDLGRAAAQAHFYLDVAIALGDGRPAESIEAVVTAAQLGRVDAASVAVESGSVRLAAGDTAVAALIRESDAAVERLAVLEAQRAAAFADGRGADASELSRTIDAARGEAAAAFDAIAIAFPDFADLIATDLVTLSDLQGEAGLLRPAEVLVAFVEREATNLNDAAWFALVITHDTVNLVKLPAAPGAVTAHIVALREQMQLSADGPATFDFDAAHALYSGLIAPIEGALAGVDHLLIVPSGSLQSFPLEALVATPPPEATTGRAAYAAAEWLGERYAITTLPSMSSLRALRRHAGAARGARPLFAIADPALRGYAPAISLDEPLAFPGLLSGPVTMNAITGSDGNFRAELICTQRLLPQTRAMGFALVRALGGTVEDSLLLGLEATEEAVYAANATGRLRDSRVVAFNTHGFTSGEMAGYGNSEPALLLTPGWDCATNAPPDEPDRANDGLLTASEVTGLDLDADWVLLTACNTAAGDRLGAEPLSGLARAFFYAGARSLLVSHWSADANATDQLITELFNPEFIELTKAQRLQRAQSLVRADPRYAHPAYWAAFSIVGEGR